MPAEEEYDEPPPPSPERVARRALILSAVCCRGMIDDKRDSWAKELSEQVGDWLQELDLQNHLSAWEQTVLSSPFGTLSAKDKTNAGWLSEGLAVLAWALGKIEMPAFDQQCDPQGVGSAIGFVQPIKETILEVPSLRAYEFLSEYNEFIYNLHWRVRSSRDKESYDFESLARKAWGEPILRHGLKLMEKDVALGGIPLSKASNENRQQLRSITQERHRASNWLIGYASEDFYEVTTDT